MTTLTASSFYDTATFVLPPKVARLDAVRKLIPRLMEVTGLGETAATTIAHSVVDPTTVRTALGEPLPGLTAHQKSHLQVIPARVWTPWITPPADDIARYCTQKVFPVADPSVPRTPVAEETKDGLILNWTAPADRDWHLADNKRLYSLDIYRDSLRVFPEKGGILTPLVLAPQTETFQDGSAAQSLLRIVDGRYRYYGVQNLLEQYAGLDQAGLDNHFGPGAVTPDIFRAALEKDRTALAKLVNVIRDACARIGYGEERQQYIGVHYLASIISLPAYIVVGTVDPVTSEIRQMGREGDGLNGVFSTLNIGVGRWHGGDPARIVITGQREYNGLLLPEASVDDKLIDVAVKRLRARGVPKEVAEFGTRRQAPAAARFVWWTRAVKQTGGAPATAVAAFAQAGTAHGEPWPQNVSQSLLACASHLMEEDIEAVYPPGDYRDPENRPDSLTLLIADAKNLTPVAALSEQESGKLLTHPRWRNAAHIALAHLAVTGALPSKEPLPEHVLNPHMLSRVALAWADGRTRVLARANGTEIYDKRGRTIPIDGQILNQNDPEWARKLTWSQIQPMTPPSAEHPYDATHVFKLKHDVVYTIPTTPLEEMEVDATPESIAKVVRRWFPDATGVTLTDWRDKLVTGVMVGSVWVRLFDRGCEREGGRGRGVWYPEGKPVGTKDILDFESADSEVPVGKLLGAVDFNGYTTEGFEQIDEAMFQELDSDIIQEIDDALEAQKTADAKSGSGPSERWDIPVLRLPEIKRGRNR